MQIEIDEPKFDAADVAQMARLPLGLVHSWTSRGLVDPHRATADIQRGRGNARRYSVRDSLRFTLMGYLHSQLSVPLPRGVRICGLVFGDSFLPENAAFTLLEQSTQRAAGVHWCKNATEVGSRLAVRPAATVINTGRMFRSVFAEAESLTKIKGQA